MLADEVDETMVAGAGHDGSLGGIDWVIYVPLTKHTTQRHPHRFVSSRMGLRNIQFLAGMVQ